MEETREFQRMGEYSKAGEYPKSREERIREARESCSRFTEDAPRQTASYGQAYYKRRLPKEEEVPAVKKGTLVRLFIAAALFLAFFSMHKFHLTPEGFTFQEVQEYIGKNDLVEQWEYQASLFIKEEVLPVFKTLP